ncbi:hypothetical protein NE237_001769 [Protea cynaroides]|uniref:Uncharacterized protein n=1 Tax=Protea cynaroides TaxID=273540 RepID=A0A9Q0QYE7_9MAGN|nr:hypothetical protein NE237_001769 [Protea cynaroides]
MGDPINLIYVYGNYSEDKTVDSARYGYIDVVYDAYSMVLKDIPDGKTVNFSVKVFLSDGIEELVLGSDSDVLHMFHEYENEDQPIQCFVFGVEVSKEFFIDYTVNGYHKSLMQRSSQTLVEKSSLNNKKNVFKKTLCKKTVSTSIVQRFAITGRDYVQRRRELTPGAFSSMTNTQLVNLSNDEDCDSDDQFVDEQVGDEAVGDEAVRDEEVRDEDVGDDEMRDDDSVDFEWGKASIEVGDDDSINSEKDLEGDEDMGGFVDSDGKLSDCKSDDSLDEIDCWVERNIDQTEKGKMRILIEKASTCVCALFDNRHNDNGEKPAKPISDLWLYNTMTRQKELFQCTVIAWKSGQNLCTRLYLIVLLDYTCYGWKLSRRSAIRITYNRMD